MDVARRDSCVGVRDELDTIGQHFDPLIPSNRYRPVREMAPSIRAGFSHMEKARDEGIELRRDGCRMRSKRNALGSCAFSLLRLAVKRCVARSINGVDCLECVGIGPHRANRVQIAIDK